MASSTPSEMLHDLIRFLNLYIYMFLLSSFPSQHSFTAGQRYSSTAAQDRVVERGTTGTNIFNIVQKPWMTASQTNVFFFAIFSQTKKGWTSVELEDAAPLLLFLVAVYSIVCLLLFVERLIDRNRERRPKTN